MICSNHNSLSRHLCLSLINLKIKVWYCYKPINFNVRVVMFLNFVQHCFEIFLNLIGSPYKTFIYLFIKWTCFILMFPTWNFISINNINKLVPLPLAIWYMNCNNRVFMQSLMLPNIFRKEIVNVFVISNKVRQVRMLFLEKSY